MSVSFTPPLSQSSNTDLRDSVIEIAFAGSALANLLMLRIGSHAYCLCGATGTNPASIISHTPHCPIARFYAATEAARKAVDAAEQAAL